MMVVTPDKALKRAVKRLTTATGSSALFVENEREIDPNQPIDLAIFDARKRAPDPSFVPKIPAKGHILYIIQPGSIADRIGLFEAPQSTSLFCYNDQFDDDEFIASATKALRGDVFGLQKYFPWGVTTFTMLVKSHEEKGMAIDIMMRYAKTAGVRGPVRDRVQLVVDELMMNALYHAPTDEHGNERNKGKTPGELSKGDVDPIEVQYGCSGKYFGVSVRDGFGSLSRDKALDYFKRVGNDVAHIEDKKSGAGLGLVSVLRSVSKLVLNLEPGYSTEAIGLFDMEVQGRGMAGARSLHLFTAAPPDPELAGPAPARPARAPANLRLWAFAAFLAMIVTGLASAYYLRSTDTVAGAEPQADVEPSLTLLVTPEDATVTLNGYERVAGTPWSFDESFESITIEVSKEGFEPWSKTLDPKTLRPNSTMYADLVPIP